MPEGFAQHDTGELVDEPGGFGQGDEDVGRYGAAGGVCPANEGLDAGDDVEGEVEFGLVVQLELVVLECEVKIREQGQSVAAAGVEFGGVHARWPPRGLGGVHGSVCVAEQVGVGGLGRRRWRRRC